MNVVELIRRETAGFRARAAVREGGRALSYGELLEAVDAAAGARRAAGLDRGDRVAFLCADGADYIVASLATLAAGAALVPVSPTLQSDEVGALVERMDVRALLFDAAAREEPGAADLPLGGGVRRRFRVRWREARGDPAPGWRAMSPAFVRFSSGTTGASKGVVLTHETIAARTGVADAALRVVPGDTIPWVLSMSFHFVVTILLFLRRGATIVPCSDPFPDAFCDALAAHRATLLYASPLHYHLLATSGRVSRERLASVRLAVSTAVRLPPATAEAFAAWSGIELAEAYGLIEVGLPLVNLPGPGFRRGTLGRPLPGCEVRILEPDAAGHGEILVRGPGVFDAYYAPWQPRAACMADGWFHTGDVGRVEDGAVVLAGRRKAVINFAGMKIFPQDVEEVLDAAPGVAESLVYGEPHPRFGQVPCARVAMKPGAPFDAAALRAHCRARLALHKVPKQFVQAGRLPRTASGKLRRDGDAPAPP